MTVRRKITKSIKKKKYETSKAKKKIKKQKGGSESDYWRMNIPSDTGTSGGFGTLVNDIYAVVGSSINTMIDTVEFIKNVTTFKSDMGSEFNSSQTPGTSGG